MYNPEKLIGRKFIVEVKDEKMLLDMSKGNLPEAGNQLELMKYSKDGQVVKATLNLETLANTSELVFLSRN